MDHHGLSWTVLDYNGPSWSVMDCLGLSWTIMDFHGLPWTVTDYPRLSQTVILHIDQLQMDRLTLLVLVKLLLQLKMKSVEISPLTNIFLKAVFPSIPKYSHQVLTNSHNKMQPQLFINHYPLTHSILKEEVKEGEHVHVVSQGIVFFGPA